MEWISGCSILKKVENQTRAKSFVRWLWLAVLLAGLYTAWVLWSRRASTAAIEQAAEEKRTDADRKIIDNLGGSEMKILAFYANPGVVKRGERGLLCYGVSNVKTVRIELGPDNLSPSLSRCAEIRPEKTTIYTLKAKDEKGREVSQSVEVKVP